MTLLFGQLLLMSGSVQQAGGSTLLESSVVSLSRPVVALSRMIGGGFTGFFRGIHELRNASKDNVGLRQELARLRTETRPELTVEQARAELAGIERRLDEIAASRIDVVKQAGGGGQGGDFGLATDALKLNWKIDEAAGRAELEARANELRSLIADQA